MKTLDFSVTTRSLGVGENKKEVQIASPTRRERVAFRQFCAMVSKSTTFSPQEVAAVINMATETAKSIVSQGDIVEFGDMGTLVPSFKSKAVPAGEEFNARKHITYPRVRLVASKKYFDLSDVSFRQVDAITRSSSGKKGKKVSEKESEGVDNGSTRIDGEDENIKI